MRNRSQSTILTALALATLAASGCTDRTPPPAGRSSLPPSGKTDFVGDAGNVALADLGGSSDGGNVATVDLATPRGDAAPPADASSSPVAVSYTYGNQVYGSTVTIHRDGTVEHSERTCCPPQTQGVAAAPLSSAALTDLLAAVEAVASGTVSSVVDGPFPDGHSVGSLTVTTAAGASVLVRGVEDLGSNLVDQRNSSRSGGTILTLVDTIADHKMTR